MNRLGARLARFAFLLLPLLTLLAWSGTSMAKEQTEARVALVIGNGGYRNSPLHNPVHDAQDMATALRSLGFQVIDRFDASQKEMNRAIAIFGEMLNTDTVALFYYAGHGLQVRGKNYLIPVDAEITGEISVRAEAVDVDTVLDQLGASELSIVILDACRNNPYERRFRSLAGGLAQMEAPKGSLIAYATAPGRTAFDGNGRNGLYTSELLKEIKKQGVPVEGVFKNVRRSVARATADQQIPWESSSLTGDFYFTPAVVSVPVMAAAAATVELPATAKSVDPAPAAPAEAARPSEPAKAETPPPAKMVEAAKPLEPAKTPEPAKNTVQETTAALATTAAMPVKSVELVKAEETVVPPKVAVAKSPAAEPLARETSPPPIQLASAAAAVASPAGQSQQRSSAALANGVRYEGQWERGLPNGAGEFTYENGDRYRGEVKDGRRHGRGRLFWARGGYWEGDFREDRQILSGQMIVQSGDMTMIGEFTIEPASGVATGSGKLSWVNGDTYEGSLVGGSKQGEGSFVWSDGQHYAGQWDKNLPNGRGVLGYSNGDHYEGAVRDGEPHGQGTYRRSNGDTYSGTWLKGLKHGHGRLTWASGGYWEGEFKDDQQTETGYMVNADSRPVVPAAADSVPVSRP